MSKDTHQTRTEVSRAHILKIICIFAIYMEPWYHCFGCIAQDKLLLAVLHIKCPFYVFANYCGKAVSVARVLHSEFKANTYHHP